MDELLTQFLVESRELVDQVAEDLLALETDPNDVQRFDDAFRGFHTLKGGAGIVEFGAMQTALHCAEDALAGARAEARPVSASDVANCLRCLDRVAEWLDAIEAAGAIPTDASADDIVALFARQEAAEELSPLPADTAAAWIESLVGGRPAAASQARTAIRYTPAADSFFRHEDPVARIAAVPQLVAVDIAPQGQWPTLEELDPFSCGLAIMALSEASTADVAAALADELPRCDVVSIAAHAPAADDDSSEQRAVELLEAQLRLLDATEPDQHGRIASAGLVAANVLRHVGRSAAADVVATAAAVSVAEGRLQPLIDAIRSALEGSSPAPAAPSSPARRQELATTVRVGAERIDTLVRLTGELIVAKNSIGHAVKQAEQEGAAVAAALRTQHAVLSRLVNELQAAAVGLRVLPLRAAFQRFPRLVHEICADLDKRARLVIEGEETEADKAIVEALVEPLVHVLRNALDHGVEEPAVRAAAGKPATATIRLRALREADNVVIEIADDGAGIDVAKVKETARRRGLLAPEALAELRDDQALELIFLPGFSTAAAVTAISGRGVGMDAVRTAVSRLGGKVEARSAAGVGTTVRITLPFSVLVTEVMTVEAGGQVFGLPLDAVVETLRIARDGIFRIGAAHAIVYRERTIPLVRLADVLARERAVDAAVDGPVVVARLGAELGALQVERMGERMDIILKPLDGLLAGMPGLAGSALLGDGSVLLVLDLAELIR